LQVERGTDFRAWRTQWDAYCILSGLSEQAPALQVQALTLCFSRETLLVVENLGLTAAQREKAKDIISALERHVDGHINESVERKKFRRRLQEPGENFDDYLVSLRDLVH
jgi:hypothetical protein